jgi:hypothetical protein
MRPPTDALVGDIIKTDGAFGMADVLLSGNALSAETHRELLQAGYNRIDVRIGGEDLHLVWPHQAGKLPSDAAEADHAKRASRQANAGIVRALLPSALGRQSGTVVHVLDEGNCRTTGASTYSYQSSRRGMGPRGRSLARIRPVRARPTVGGSLRSTTIMGSTVNPVARRSGETISSPLQIVGVSQALRASRSAVVNG